MNIYLFRNCFAIFNSYSQVMWKQLVWPIFKRLQTLNGPNIIKYHQISRGNLGQKKTDPIGTLDAGKTSFNCSLYESQFMASLNFLWGFRLQQPCLYQLPRTRWCQTLLAPHHSAGWPIILEMQFYQVCYCSVDCSNALTSCQNALGSGWVSTNKALHLAVWPFPITLASWPGGHEDSFWHQMQQDSARPYSIHNYT